MKKASITFDQFSAACKSAGVEPKMFGRTHWRISAEQDGTKVLVDFWPTSAGGSKYLVVGRDGRASRGDVQTAIRAALAKPSDSTGGGELAQLRKVAKLAIEYLRFDGKLLDQMCQEQAHACVDLLAALRVAGYRVSVP
jgi:hypothetical protein